MKKILSLVLVLAFLAGLASGCGTKETPSPKAVSENDKIVLTVADKQMSKADANIYLYSAKINVERMGMGPTIWVNEIEPGKTFETAQLEQLKNTLSYVNILNLEAAKRNLSLPTEDEAKIADEAKKVMENLPAEVKEYYGFSEEGFARFFKEQGMVIEVFKDEMKDFKADTDKLKTLYQADQKYQKMESIGLDHYFDKVRAKHILISTLDSERKPLPEDKKAEAKKKAEDILKRAKAGEDFAALAKEFSEDPGSKESGGEYTFGYGQMVPEFEATAFSLKEGEISELVETTFGYHIIKLEEKLPSTAEEKKQAEELRTQIIKDYEEQLKAEEFQKRYEALKQNYELKFDEEVFNTLSLSYTVPVKAPEAPEAPAEKAEEPKQEK